MSRMCNDSSSNCSTPDQLIMVVYSSNTERILNLILVISVLIFAGLGQLSVIVTVWKTVSLHTQHFIIIVTYCAGDLAVLITQTTMYIWCFLAGSIPLMLCRFLSVQLYAPVFGLASHICYMAFERYVYFCNAMKYETLFNKRNMAFSIGCIYTVSYSYVIATEVITGRDYHSSVMACNMSGNQSTQSIIQAMVFVLPTVIITSFCSFKIWRQSVKSSVAPTAPSQGKETGSPKQQATRALRVILLVSGVFWATSLPVSMTRSIYFNSGITWEDLDTRRSYDQAIFLRVNYYLYSLVSPTMNPLIYYYNRKDLRIGLRKVLGISTAVAPQDQ